MIKKSICVLVAFLLTGGIYMNPRENNNNINNEIYSEKTDFQELEILAPQKLSVGDTICILEPSRMTEYRAKIFEKRLPIVIKNLEDRGFKVVVYEDSFATTPLGVGDGTEDLRADLFNQAVRNPEIKAIFAFWGGYGAMHILDKIDYDSFRKNRKIFVGFSDETVIEIAILKKSGIITFHGPMIGASLNYSETKTFDNLFDILMNPKENFELKNIDDNCEFDLYNNISETEDINCDITGTVFGGNLCLVQSLIGTDYEPEYNNKILFFEEIEEDNYKIHRILWQLKLNHKLDNLKAVIIGSLIPNHPKETEENLRNICFDVFKNYNIPVLCNFHAGHISNPLTLPIGATLNIKNNRIFLNQMVGVE